MCNVTSSEALSEHKHKNHYDFIKDIMTQILLFRLAVSFWVQEKKLKPPKVNLKQLKVNLPEVIFLSENCFTDRMEIVRYHSR